MRPADRHQRWSVQRARSLMMPPFDDLPSIDVDTAAAPDVPGQVGELDADAVI